MSESSSVAYRPLKPAAPVIDARGVPFSPEYGDIYHAADGALAQAQHVFLRGNDLPQRWRGRASFTVCETGFGLGSNFLALWLAWRADAQRPRRLHVVSFEAHPLLPQDLAGALARLPADSGCRVLADQLLRQWPPLLPGVHRLEFERGGVTLTLAFGDAGTLAPQLDFVADAFFLDGFAPARNPEMWTPALLQALGAHAAHDATAATWCSAGRVRRALQEAGFAVDRRPGFAGKTHMTVARRIAAGRAPAGDPPPHVAIVGAGIAGAAVAQALGLRGIPVTLLDPAHDAAHRGHLAAAATPLVALDDNPRARLSRAGTLRALARWGDLDGDARPLQCGTLQLSRDAGRAADAGKVLAALGFPASWVRQVDAAEASDIAGLAVSRGGLFFQAGLLVRPDALIHALSAVPGVRRVPGAVHRMERNGDTWRLEDEAGRVLADAPVVVAANAVGARRLLHASGLLEPLPRLAQMHALAGEVTLLPAHALAGGPRCIIGGEGYLLPAVHGHCVAGSTYVHGAAEATVSAGGQGVNLAKAAALLDADAAAAVGSMAAGALSGWAGWRAVLPGRLPAVGPVSHAEGLYLATGFGSRGLSWAALAGDIIAAHLCGEPAPLENDLLRAIAPR
ncbi:FAD-dependent cmnm(5)s(2)U34 oxidoreductase [Bordetella genomosp. 9]|uniref:FAD-dependent 5-carboxymethylaminomethyl-2-thiouridine(34) oxidoreductase MnmC n=1 Tax=Bordetella genomosp. 9 TaxID=1416803 RepID=UPI000A297236|nr:FAD-dependent 5-carboxymethylaminomethyl-2-thiouridine(34) oxidoreductase MnmC [Bordetella genomosp. 9]ARP89607.1 FAD-dependent cmnm(5)s(2)U34 oxidoreductase [Bordetella genomosp. 9]